MRRRGRPGLLGTIGRTAVIAGTAQATSNAVNRRAQERAFGAAPVAAPMDAGPAPAPAAAAPAPAAPAAGSTVGADLIADLTNLAKLHEAGVLSAEEFAAAKAKLLAQ